MDHHLLLRSPWWLLVLACFLTLAHARSVYDEISSNPELSKFKEWVNKDDILVAFLKKRSVTAFAPTNAAIAAFTEKDKNNQLTASLVNYHASLTVVRRDQFPFSISSMEGKYAPLYLTVKPFGPVSSNPARRESDKNYYINNAYVLEAREDLTAGPSGAAQVLYIIDEVLAASEPTNSVPPTALELINNPSIYSSLGDKSFGPFLEAIRRNNLESVFSSPGQNTFFIPTKGPVSGSSSEFDKYVVQAHVLRNAPLFVRTLGDKKKYNTLAFDDTVEVELSLINLTSRFSSDKMYFIQTNTVKNDAGHKVGKVLSRLVVPNIPVKNGIVHIIDKPLMLMDLSVRDILNGHEKLSKFRKMLESHQDILSELGRNPHKTLLVPDDNAFLNLQHNNQNFSEFDASSEEIKKMLRQHLVLKSVSSADLKKAHGSAVYNSSANIPLTFRLIGTDGSARLTVESGGVNATSIQSDFGASDGILHIIDRVLGQPFKTLREKLRQEPLLRETFKIGTQGGTANWNSKLSDENKRYTFFAPSDQAWVEFGKENPSERKQLDQELYPPISRAIFDRHLSAKGQYNSKELFEKVRKVETIQGELIISPDPKTKEVYVEWEGKKAKIIKTDIYGLNGVIHIIDTVLAKKRDFKINSAFNCQATSTLILTLSLAASFIAGKLF